jgi:DNA topoisomerase I-like protein
VISTQFKPRIPSLFPSRFALKRFVKGNLFFHVKDQSTGTCKQGERSDLTGCQPASGQTGAKKPKPKLKLKFPDKIRLRSQGGSDLRKTEQATKTILGHKPSPELMGAIVGALDGASIGVWSNRTVHNGGIIGKSDVAYVLMNVDHSEYEAQRMFFERDGQKIMSNTEFLVTTPGKGIGTQIFSDQVANLVTLGFSKIITEAARNDDPDEKMNGYYTWPRLGYDGPIPKHISDGLSGNYKNAKTVQELFAMEGGMEEWEEHGDTLKLEFDLSPGSRSRKVLAAYLEEKGIEHAARDYESGPEEPRGRNRPQRGRGRGPEPSMGETESGNGAPFRSRFQEARGKSLVYFTKDKTGTCGVGQNPKRDGCTAASEESGAKKPKKEEDEPALIKRRERAHVDKLTKAHWEGEGNEKKLVLADGSIAPAHITPQMAPAYLRRIKINPNPDGDVLVSAQRKNKKGVWIDIKVYNERYQESNKAANFAMCREGLKKLPQFQEQIQRDRQDPVKKETADVCWLMMEQATRVDTGNDNKGVEHLFGQPMTKDNVVITKKEKVIKRGPRKGETDVQYSVKLKFGDEEFPVRSEKSKEQLIQRVEQNGDLFDSTFWLKSYGATTLEGRHVIEAPDGVRLRFMAKETIWHDHKIRDPELAQMLLERKQSAGSQGKLFDTDYGDVIKYNKGLDGGDFTPKDFRTMRGTSEALELMKKYKTSPVDVEELNSRQAEIGGAVSQLLGNEPLQCLESYIDPFVWQDWKSHAEAGTAERTKAEKTKQEQQATETAKKKEKEAADSAKLQTDVDAHIVKMRQEHEARMAKRKAEEEERNKRVAEHLAAMDARAAARRR